MSEPRESEEVTEQLGQEVEKVERVWQAESGRVRHPF